MNKLAVVLIALSSMLTSSAAIAQTEGQTNDISYEPSPLPR